MASGVVFRFSPAVCQQCCKEESEILSAGPSYCRFSFAGYLGAGKVLRSRCRGFSALRAVDFSRGCRFSDDGCLQYYLSPRSHEKKEKGAEALMSKKKKKKLIKGLTKGLKRLSYADVEAGDGLIGEVRGKMISEAASVLLTQLQQLRAEDKERKREERRKNAFLSTANATSSSSESSDSECEEKVEEIPIKSCLGIGALAIPQINDLQPIPADFTNPNSNASIQEQQDKEEATVKFVGSSSADCDSVSAARNPSGEKIEVCMGDKEEANVKFDGSSSADCDSVSATRNPSGEKIEVCMGGKCKKAGAMELFGELERMVGMEGAVVGCKCMKNCREGPNLRLVSSGGENPAGSMTKTLCTGVDLKDVAEIIADFLGKRTEDGLGVAAA